MAAASHRRARPARLGTKFSTSRPAARVLVRTWKLYVATHLIKPPAWRRSSRGRQVPPSASRTIAVTLTIINPRRCQSGGDSREDPSRGRGATLHRASLSTHQSPTMLSFEVFKLGLKLRGSLERYERTLATLAPGGEVTFTHPCIFTDNVQRTTKENRKYIGRRHANVINVYA